MNFTGKRGAQARLRHLLALALFLPAVLLQPLRAAEGAAVQSRIIDGTNVPDSTFPTVGAVGDSLYGEPVYYGSGTLIGSRYVLTAGHVVTDSDGMLAIPSGYGCFRLGGKVYKTARIFVHPTYRGDASYAAEGDFDLAVLELETNVPGIAPTPLYRKAPAVGALLTIAGYGLVGNGRDGVTQYSDVPPPGTIEYGTTPLELATPTFLAWQFEDVPPPNQEADTSPGDSGGPAFITEDGVKYLAGVTCGGSVSACTYGDIALDIRIDPVVAWIDRLLAGQAANDQFADAAPLYGTQVSLLTGNGGATKEAGEPAHAGNAGGASLWWKWTAPSTGLLTVSTIGSNFDTLLALYTGKTVDSLTPVSSNDNIDAGATPPQLASAFAIQVVGGKTYYIAVDGVNGATGQILLSLSLSGNADLQVSSIECAPAAPVPGELMDFIVTIYNQGTAPAYCTVGFWTHLDNAPTLATVPEQTDTILIDGGGKAFLYFSAPAPNLPQAKAWAYVDTYLGTSQVAEPDENNNTGSATYFVIANCVNDNFADATDLSTGDAAATCGNANATLEPGEPQHAGRPGGRSVWFKWTALASGPTTIATDGSSFDTLLGVYTGTSVSALKEIASNDDYNGDVASSVDFNAIAGKVYHIAVDGLNGAYGRIELYVSGGSATEMQVKRAQFRFDFKTPARDSLSLSGMLQLSTPWIAAAQNAAHIYAGDMTLDYALDSHGQSAGREFRISARNGVARFTLNVRNKTLFDSLQSAGFTNADVKGASLVVPVVLVLNQDSYVGVLYLSYSAKAGVGGSAK